MDVFNLQRKVTLDLASIRAFVAVLAQQDADWTGKTFSVAFVADRRMKQLNAFFRNTDSTTDVLSFPHVPDEFVSDSEDPVATVLGPDFLGDIVISAEQAQQQATENDLMIENEIKQLIVHGLLHLCGYDHETDNGEMNARELELRDKLGI